MSDKIIIFIIVFGSSLAILFSIPDAEKKVWNPSPPIEIPDDSVKVDSIEYTPLIRAIIFVESSGRDSVINHRTNAVGCMQIRPIMVKEVNRILNKRSIKDSFNLEDRFSRAKSIEMFNIWKSYWHPGDPYEVVSRCWNGGVRGNKKKSTERYWKKVKQFLRENEL
jgi:hypothetical protein